MTKKNFLKKAGITSDEFDNFVNAMKETFMEGEDLTLSGVGTFKVVEKKETTARNPKTGEKINVPAKKVLKFKVSPKLKEEIA